MAVGQRHPLRSPALKARARDAAQTTSVQALDRACTTVMAYAAESDEPVKYEGFHAQTPIDLTLDDSDDVQLQVVTPSTKRPRSVSPEDDDSWAMYTPRPKVENTMEWICLGMIQQDVLCMYGAPPELHWDRMDLLPPVDPAWTHLGFWGQPGYRPVSIHESASSSGSSRANELCVSTLCAPRDGRGHPTIINEYGKLSARASKSLHPLLQFHAIQCVSRAPLISSRRAPNFTHQIETLIFTRAGNKVKVEQALFQAGLVLETPSTYQASDYPNAPILDIPDTHAPSLTLERPVAMPQATAHVVEESTQSHIDAIYAALGDTDSLEETEAGPLVSTPLFPHQKQALSFLLERERERHFEELLEEGAPQHISLWTVYRRKGAQIEQYRNIVTGTVRRKRPTICRGAILADDMGLGKTLTIISLIAYTHENACIFQQSALDQGDDDDEPLVIGDSRNRRTAEQARKEELRCKSRATLLVCPLTVVYNWLSQIRQHWRSDQQPDVYVYHGPGRTSHPQALADHDIVITTYSTLGNEFSNQTVWTAAAGRTDDDVQANGPRLEAPNPCQRIEWYRVVLDEAHIVKEARTWQSKAVCNLSSACRICLTGTPIQNRISDLYALLVFLRLDPFTDRAIWNRFCGDRDHIRLNSQSTGVRIDPSSLERLQAIMKFLTLRRMKSDTKPDGQPLLALPPKTTRIVTLHFDEAERAKYQRLHSEFREEFMGYVDQGTVGLHYATILHEILILRMMCDHADLVKGSIEARRLDVEETEDLARAVKWFEALLVNAMASCALCGHEFEQGDADALRRPVVTKCQHIVCSVCFGQRAGQVLCPVCAQALHVGTDTIQPHTDVVETMFDTPDDTCTGPFVPEEPSTWPASWSTKLRALISDLIPFSRCNTASQLYDPKAPVLDHVIENGTVSVGVSKHSAPIKSVVFSQWTRMLSKVQHALIHAGIGFRQLDGSMSREARESAMAEFHDDPRVEVFLVSLRAGGFGLNLIAGCRAYLLDPYWNPAVEQQGLDRIHRMGQQRAIIMTKYIMHQSIEEKLLVLQQRKLELANQVGRRRDRQEATRTEDLQLLFS